MNWEHGPSSQSTCGHSDGKGYREPLDQNLEVEVLGRLAALSKNSGDLGVPPINTPTTQAGLRGKPKPGGMDL